MDDEISIHLFCHSFGSQLGLLLRLVKDLLLYSLSGHAARDCRLDSTKQPLSCFAL